MKHVINLAVAPFCPERCYVEAHQKGSPSFEWEQAKIALYFDEAQKNGNVNGYHLRSKLQYKPVFNANMLDYVLAHPELIPDDWKGKEVCFWGTLYFFNSRYHVRYLFWYFGGWSWAFRRLSDHCSEFGPALISA